MMGKWLMRAMLVLCFALMGTTVKAETLRISGVYPAGDPDAAAIKSISIGRFTGNEGESLANELEAQLSGVMINNEQYFTVMGYGGGRADATISGGITTKVETSEIYQKRKFCLRQTHDAKCYREEWRNIKCERRNVVVTISIRLVTTVGNRLVYSKSKTDTRNNIQCPDDSFSDSMDESIQQMIKTAASEARFDLAPSFREERVRLVEDTDGMDKPTAKAFKEALRTTKRNEDTACDQFDQLKQTIPNHKSLIFNLALCADKRGRYVEAATLYRQALPLFPNKDLVNAGLKRVADRQRAESELERRRAPVRKRK